MRLPQVQQTNTGVLDVRDPTQNVVGCYKMVQVHISIQYNRMHACDILTIYRVTFFYRVSSLMSLKQSGRHGCCVFSL